MPIVWLASYPRSGNTLLRILLAEHFGVSSYSVYTEENDIRRNERLIAKVVPAGQISSVDQLRRLRDSRELSFVKTHGRPNRLLSKADSVIYCHRDIREVVGSYSEYSTNFASADERLTIEQVATGRTPFGLWSSHARDWLHSSLPHIQVVSYAELATRGTEVMSELAGFLDLPVGEQPAEIDFLSLRDLDNKFFTKGLGRNKSELTEFELAVCELFNWPAMDELGYERLNLTNHAAIDLYESILSPRVGLHQELALRKKSNEKAREHRRRDILFGRLQKILRKAKNKLAT